MKINPLTAAIGFVLIDQDFSYAQARARRASSTGTAAGSSDNGPHLAQGLPRGGGGVSPDVYCSGNGEAHGHD